MEDIKEQKKQVRGALLKARNALTKEEVESKTKEFTEKFFDHQEIMYKIINSQTCIGIYFPIGNELSPIPLAKMLQEMHGKGFCLPITKQKNAPLRFAKWDLDENRLIPSSLYSKIKEPKVNNESEYMNPDVIIVPLVGFDDKNNRIGMGEGFYDRTIEYYTNMTNGNLVTIGIGYDIQQIDHVPTDDSDKRLDFIVTNS